MPSKPVTSALGLYRTPNPLGGAQDGGYRELRNCCIRNKDVIEPRRGQSQVPLYIGSNRTDTRRINALGTSSLGTLAQYGSGTTSGIGVLETLGTAILSDVDPPSPWVRTRFADCQKRCYVTTDSGLKRIDSSGVGAAAGGLVAKISTVYSHPVYDTSGFLAANTACMYRAVFVNFAPDGAEIVGPPSNRFYCRVPADQTIAIGGAVRTTNVLTITTPAAHNLRVGDAPYIDFAAGDSDPNEFDDGAKTIATVPSATTFTVAETDSDYTSLSTATLKMGAAKATVRVLLPTSGASTSTVVRLYRSEQTSTATGSPLDDVYEVYEAYLTSTNISNGYVEITDNTPEVLLGDPSYFSPSVEGESGGNDTPPLAWDACAMGDAVLLGNLTYQQRLEVRLLATGGASGVTAGVGYLTLARSGYGTISIAYDNSFNAAPASGFASGIVYSGGTVARDIEATALAICDAINFCDTNNWVDAIYISQLDDAPGKILLRARDFSATTFTVKDDTYPTAWAPNLPNTGGVATSKQEIADADLAVSKSGQPDAFPGLQRLRVGSPNEKLLRVIPARDKAIVLKEASAWLVSGSWPNLRVDLLDDAIEFPLPDTAASMDGQVYVLSSVGVVSISESGVANMGSPIEGDLRPVVEQALRTKSLLSTYATIPALASWGAVDELEHRYILGVPKRVKLPSSGTTLDQAVEVDNLWVYNASPRAWSGPWPLRHRHAAAWKGASSSGRLVFARQDVPGVLKEVGLDSNTVLQFSDYLGQTLYIESVTDATVVLRSASGFAITTGGLEVGDRLYTSAGFAARVTAVGSASVTVDDAGGLSAAATVSVLKGYRTRVEPVPLSQSFPADTQATGFNLAMSEARFGAATVYLGNERSGDRSAKVLTRPGFGSGVFGTTPFGDGPGLHKERGQATIKGARGNFTTLALETREAGAFFRLHAFALDFEVGSPKGVR